MNRFHSYILVLTITLFILKHDIFIILYPTENYNSYNGVFSYIHIFLTIKLINGSCISYIFIKLSF